VTILRQQPCFGFLETPFAQINFDARDSHLPPLTFLPTIVDKIPARIATKRKTKSPGDGFVLQIRHVHVSPPHFGSARTVGHSPNGQRPSRQMTTSVYTRGCATVVEWCLCRNVFVNSPGTMSEFAGRYRAMFTGIVPGTCGPGPAQHVTRRRAEGVDR